jgi:hypothetical protein
MIRSGALTAGLVLLLVVPAAAQVPQVEIVAPDNLALTYDGSESSRGSVWVRNGTDAAFAPRFRASVEKADGAAKPLEVVVVDDAGEEVSQAHDVRAHDVTRYRLFLRASPKSELADASGELVVSGGDDVDSLSLSVAKKAFADKGVTGALLFPLAPAFVLVLLGGLLAIVGKKIDLFDSLTSDLDYSKSFASTLTAVGALLGTVIAASVLPEETTTLSKAAFVALNLIFGVGVVVAGLVYATFHRGVWTDVKPEGRRRADTPAAQAGGHGRRLSRRLAHHRVGRVR